MPGYSSVPMPGVASDRCLLKARRIHGLAYLLFCFQIWYGVIQSTLRTTVKKFAFCNCHNYEHGERAGR